MPIVVLSLKQVLATYKAIADSVLRRAAFGQFSNWIGRPLWAIPPGYCKILEAIEKVGRGEWIRTADLLVPNLGTRLPVIRPNRNFFFAATKPNHQTPNHHAGRHRDSDTLIACEGGAMSSNQHAEAELAALDTPSCRSLFDRVKTSPAFSRSPRLRQLFEYLCEHSLADPSLHLTEE